MPTQTMLLLRAFSLCYLVVYWQSLISSLWLLYWKFSILAKCKYENMIVAIEWLCKFYPRRIYMYKTFIVAAVFCIIWSKFNFDLFYFKFGMNQSLHALKTFSVFLDMRLMSSQSCKENSCNWTTVVTHLWVFSISVRRCTCAESKRRKNCLLWWCYKWCNIILFPHMVNALLLSSHRRI